MNLSTGVSMICCHSTWEKKTSTHEPSLIHTIPTPQSPLTKVDYQRCDWSLKIFEHIYLHIYIYLIIYIIYYIYLKQMENNI